MTKRPFKKQISALLKKAKHSLRSAYGATKFDYRTEPMTTVVSRNEKKDHSGLWDGSFYYDESGFRDHAKIGRVYSVNGYRKKFESDCLVGHCYILIPSRSQFEDLDLSDLISLQVGKLPSIAQEKGIVAPDIEAEGSKHEISASEAVSAYAEEHCGMLTRSFDKSIIDACSRRVVINGTNPGYFMAGAIDAYVDDLDGVTKGYEKKDLIDAVRTRVDAEIEG